MNNIQQSISDVLPSRRRSASKGWTVFNAPCCVHNGETPDLRSRGGILFTPEGGFTYHCFNCQFKTGWMPGSHLGYKVRSLLSWMGMPEDRIRLLVFEAMRQIDTETVQKEFARKTVNFKPVEIPLSENLARLVAAGADQEEPKIARAVEYLTERGFSLDDYDFRWSPETEHGLNRRVIIPFLWQGKEIGYTARSINENSKLKYFNQFDSDYVFNTDAQTAERKFVLVSEGPLDALALDGVSPLTNTVNEQKAEIIESLGKQVITVPDRDHSGEQLINDALEYGWAVSFPEWQPDIKDAAQAMQRYGKLYTLRSVLAGVETSALKIKLRTRDIFS